MFQYKYFSPAPGNAAWDYSLPHQSHSATNHLYSERFQLLVQLCHFPFLKLTPFCAALFPESVSSKMYPVLCDLACGVYYKHRRLN